MAVTRPPSHRPPSRLASTRTAKAGVRAAALAITLALPAAAAPAKADGELRPLYRSARATAMGGAFAAVADDEGALFYNPAGLAGLGAPKLTYAAVDLEFSKGLLTGYSDVQAALSNTTPASLNVLMGKQLFAHAQVAPSFTMRGFGLAAIVDGQAALRVRNEAIPQLNFLEQQTQGVQAAYGTTVFRHGGKRGTGELRIGAAGKLLWRKGGFRTMPLPSLLTVSSSSLQSLMGTMGHGYGMDFGTQYLYRPSTRLTLSSALTWTDAGDTKFDSDADPIRSNFTFGLAAKYTLPGVTVTLAYDYRNAFTATDPRMRQHAGLELGLPFLTILGGYGQTSLSYGIAFDAWLFRVTAVSYGEEVGTFANQDSERRYLLSASLNFGL